MDEIGERRSRGPRCCATHWTKCRRFRTPNNCGTIPGEWIGPFARRRLPCVICDAAP